MQKLSDYYFNQNQKELAILHSIEGELLEASNNHMEDENLDRAIQLLSVLFDEKNLEEDFLETSHR